MVSGDYSSFRGTVFGVPILRVFFFSQVSNLQKSLTWVELKKALFYHPKRTFKMRLILCGPYHGKDKDLTE